MKTAILLIAYKRFNILEQVIEALNKNKHYDLIVNFDHHDELDKYEEIKKKILTYYPNANISMRPKQFGCNLNVICSIHDAFYKYGYDRIFYTEDDVIYEPNCLETLENLMNWADTNLDNVGIVQSYNYNVLDPDYASKYYKFHGLEELDYSKSCTFAENEVGYTGQNYFGCMMSKKMWDVISPYVINHFLYMQQKKGFNFQNYQELIRKLIKAKCTDAVKYRLVSRFNPIGWEPIFDLSMVANNFFKLTLTNPRSKTIGENGDSSTDNMFTTVGLDKVITLNSPNIPTEFILNKESERLWIKQ